MTRNSEKLRSADWFGREDKGGFIHRSWMKRGLPEHEFDGRPVIGICNTWSELTPCNIHFRDLAEAVTSRRVRLDRLHRLDDEAVIEELVQVRGIGRWTAQMFLIFCLGRLDVFAPLDLGIRAGIQREYQLGQMPDVAACEQMAQAWAPFRSVACLYLWRSGDLEL